MRQRKMRAWWAASLLLTMMVAGCGGGPEAALVGNWKVNASSVPLPPTTANNPAGAAMAKQMLGNMTLELKKDKTFAMNMMLQMEGTWAYNDADKTVALSMTKMSGMDMTKMPNYNAANQKPLNFKLSDDNAHLTMQGAGGAAMPAGGTMTFDKQ